MKISYNWLKQYIALTEHPEAVGKLLTGCGLEVEGIEEYAEIQGGLTGIVIGEVLTCQPHPNADKLTLTTVDIGNGVIAPIVCGAPNVAPGQKVVVATVGSTLYPTDGEPFQIKKAKIRGEASEGMICAEDEIGIGHSHAGIIVLHTDLPNGTPAAEYFKPAIDQVFEIGLTPNRADAASHLGVARDLKVLSGAPLSLPNYAEPTQAKGDLSIKVEVLDTVACPRYSGIVIEGIKVAESPNWLKNYLKAIGLAPINNVVDITNYVLHSVGQPLHAFDAAKISGGKVIVRSLAEGTKFTTLDGKERQLGTSDLMICNADAPMCIAGVFGGLDSGISESTTAVFLESAYFSADSVRKTAQKHQLKTDASFRFERGTDPNMTVYALKMATNLILDVCGGKVTSSIIDIYPNPVEDFMVNVKNSNINRLIGIELPKEKIAAILTGLDIKLSNITEQGFTAHVPPYRVDVTREADIIEEILRIFGYDNVPLSTQLGSEFLANFPKKDKLSYKNQISDLLVSNGFYEIFNNSLTSPTYTEGSQLWATEGNVTVLNKLSEDLGILRRSMVYSGLESIRYNISHRQADLKFFEIGKTYAKQPEKYEERENLAMFVTGQYFPEHWSGQMMESNFYHLSQYVYMVLEKAGITSHETVPTSHELFAYGLDLLVNGKVLAQFGKLNSKTGKALGVKQDVFYAEIDWALFIKYGQSKLTYREVPKFPEVRRDLSLVIDKSITFSRVKEVATSAERRFIKRMNVFSVYEGDKIDADKKAYAISFVLQDSSKTLEDKSIDKIMQLLMRAFEQELGAVIRK